MADEQNEIRRINWKEVFGFTQLFKGWRMAVHPSKLVLALAAVLTVYCAGRVLDGVWCGAGSYARVQEPYMYYSQPPQQFDQAKTEWLESRPERVASLWKETLQQRTAIGTPLGQYYSILNNLTGGSRLASEFLKQARSKYQQIETAPEPPERDKLLEKAEDDWSEAMADVEEDFEDEVEEINDLLEPAYESAEDAIDADTNLTGDEKDEALEELEKDFLLAEQALARRKMQFAEQVRQIRGTGIFSSLLSYETECVKGGIHALVQGDILSGLEQYRQNAAAKGFQAAAVQTEPFPPAETRQEPRGLLVYMLMAAFGICWLISEHWVFAVIFLAVALAALSLFGGAICRIAALHAAREEKISMSQALRFSAGKFLSFFTAPLLPLAIVIIGGAVIALGGFAFGNYAGGILMGILFPLAIIGGLIIAFLLIGLIAGGGLMYPTIAVEGSDTFDAISRSYNYVFKCPWRSLLYAGVAAVYGALTYLFVRFFAFLALWATHYFASWGVFRSGAGVHPEADRMDVLWSAPTFSSLHGAFNWAAMGGWEKVAAVIIGFWVYLVVGLVIAYLVSYAAGSTTLIYYLLRRKIDATDLDDVYVEQDLEEFQEEEVAEEAEAGEEEKPAAEEGEGEEEPPSEETGEEEGGEEGEEGEEEKPEE